MTERSQTKLGGIFFQQVYEVYDARALRVVVEDLRRGAYYIISMHRKRERLMATSFGWSYWSSAW